MAGSIAPAASHCPRRGDLERSRPAAMLNSRREVGVTFNCAQPPALSNGSTALVALAGRPVNVTLGPALAPRPAMARPRYASPDNEIRDPTGTFQSPVAAHASTFRP